MPRFFTHEKNLLVLTTFTTRGELSSATPTKELSREQNYTMFVLLTKLPESEVNPAKPQSECLEAGLEPACPSSSFLMVERLGRSFTFCALNHVPAPVH